LRGSSNHGFDLGQLERAFAGNAGGQLGRSELHLAACLGFGGCGASEATALASAASSLLAFGDFEFDGWQPAIVSTTPVSSRHACRNLGAWLIVVYLLRLPPAASTGGLSSVGKKNLSYSKPA